MKKATRFLALVMAISLLMGLTFISAAQGGWTTNLTKMTAIGGVPWVETEEGLAITATGADQFYLSEIAGDNFTLETDIRTGRAGGFIIHAKDDPNAGSYLISLDAFFGAVRLIGLPYTGVDASQNVDLVSNQWYHLRVVTQDKNIKIYLDGALVLDVNGSKHFGGRVGLFVNNGYTVYQNTKYFGEFDNLSEVTLNRQSVTLGIGGTRTLTADRMPMGATNKDVVWSVQPAGIAELTVVSDTEAVITGVAAGTAQVKVASAVNAAVSATCEVVVEEGYVNPDIINPSFEEGTDGWTFTGVTGPKLTASGPVEGKYALSTGGVGTVYNVVDGALAYEREAEGDQLGVIKQALAQDVTVEADLTLGANTLFSFMARSNAAATQGFLCILTPAAKTIRYIRLPYIEIRSQSGVSIPVNKEFHFRMDYFSVENGRRAVCFIDGKQVFSYTDTSNNALTGSHVGLFNFRDEGRIDNLKVYAYGTDELLYEDDFQTDTIDDYYFRDNAVSNSTATIAQAISEPFVASKRYIRFGAMGKTDADTYVEVINADGGVVGKVTPANGESGNYYLDIATAMGQAVRIRVVDDSKSGRLVVDDFIQTDRMEMGDDVSLLEAQVGYHTQDVKKAYLRSAKQNPTVNPAGLPFQVLDEAGDVVYTATVELWGEKWESVWWTLDFSAVKTPGTYTVVVDGDRLISSPFQIRDDIFTNSRLDPLDTETADLVDIAMLQLDARLLLQKDGKAVPGWENEYVPGWRDCGSEIRELSSHVVTLHGLADMYDNPVIYDNLSVEYRQKLIDQVIWGADYVVFSQEHSDNPLTNGRFDHDAAYQTEYGTSHFHNWHDTAYALTGLMRAYQVVKASRPDKAVSYLACAELGYENAMVRQYNLASDLWGKTNDDGNPIDSTNETAYVNQMARQNYDLPGSWIIPETLKSKDKLTFLWALTMMYQETGEDKYLATAIEYARSAAERQFTDWENPIEGVFGNFYEYEDNDWAFSLEWNQNHRYHMGNIEPTNVQGFIELYNMLPNHPDRAMWYNVITTYAYNYVKPTADLSPMGIHPLTTYKNEEFGGVKFFQVTNHGGTGMYGQIARNMMYLGDFLNDADFQVLANNNLQFVAGLNTGIPTSYVETQWNAKSLIKGLGYNSLSDHAVIIPAPLGSGLNGFSADTQFGQQPLGVHPDAPKGVLNPDGSSQFMEDYLPHSHGYVSGVAAMEDNFTLSVRAYDNGLPVEADVTVYLRPEMQLMTYQTLTDGALVITDLPLLQEGDVSIRYNGMYIERPLQTLGGGSLNVDVDFAFETLVAIQAPSVIEAGQSGEVVVTLENRGTQTVTALLDWSSYGVSLSGAPEQITVVPGGGHAVHFDMTAGEKVTTYTILAKVSVGDRAYTGTFGGKVASYQAAAITSMTVTPGTLVADYAANVLVFATADSLAPEQTLETYLEQDGYRVTSPVTLVDGKTTIRVPKDVLQTGTYDVVVRVSGTQIADSRPIVVEPNDPGLWTPHITEDDEGSLSIRFAAAIGPKASGYTAVLDGSPIAVRPGDDATSLTMDVDYQALPEGGHTLVVGGVKYPVLFPSYSFTFTLTFER